MQKLGKKFPNYLEKSACILMTEFYGQKNLLMTQRKIDLSCALFSKKRVCQSLLKTSNVWKLSLVRSGHNYL